MFPSHTRFLIVEDIASMRDVVVATLKNLGFNAIVTAKDGKDALEKFYMASQSNRPIQVIISDWNMPEMNGITLLEEIRQLPSGKSLPFLLLTTESEKAKVVEAITLGVSNYMVKPVSESTMHAKLLEVWKRHSKKS